MIGIMMASWLLHLESIEKIEISGTIQTKRVKMLLFFWKKEYLHIWMKMERIIYDWIIP